MNKHLTDIEIFEYANELMEDSTKKAVLKTHLSSCEECRIQIKSEKQVNEILTSKLMVNETVDVSDKVTTYFAAKEFAKAPDNKWVLYVILGLVVILTGMELMDSFLLNQNFNPNYISNMRLIIAAIAAILFVDVFVKFVKYRKQLI